MKVRQVNMNLILKKSLKAPKAHISRSSERNSLFSEKDKNVIKILCAKLIVGGKINKDSVRYCLGQNMDGKKILKEFTFVQIRARLYYERNLLKLMYVI